MASNQQATIRYNVLDRCFSNFNKKFFITDLQEACEEAMMREYGHCKGCSARQIRDDISFMKKAEGHNAPILSLSEGKKAYYRYENKEFSIYKNVLSPAHLQQIKEAMHLLAGIKGVPGLEWASSALVKLDQGFDEGSHHNALISFEENMYLQGIDYLELLYQSILYLKVLEISYQSFNSKVPKMELISPQYLKQYNNRWFLFGYNHREQKIQNLALDRIQEVIENSHERYKPSEISYEEYFEDIIGVSQKEEDKVEKVVLRLTPQLVPYIQSKPLHGSQKLNKDSNILTLEVKLNYELEATIFSFADQMTVIKPEKLAVKMQQRINNMQQNYDCSDFA